MPEGKEWKRNFAGGGVGMHGKPPNMEASPSNIEPVMGHGPVPSLHLHIHPSLVKTPSTSGPQRTIRQVFSLIHADIQNPILRDFT